MDEARPLEMLAGWLRDAREAGLEEHDAVALATVDARGRPWARTVSLAPRGGRWSDLHDGPCPAEWGAFRIRPDVIEYWTAAPDAMHDRIVLVRDGRRWRVTRLAP
jgi:pyridoxine/pyridoxamine 5'-phosphate oxidase